MKRKLANHEIVTVALYLLGGERRPVHTEEVALKSQEIAPGRFSWARYKDLVDKEAVRKRLWDARKQSVGAYVEGSDARGWMLTAAGVSFASKQASAIGKQDLSRTRLSSQEVRWVRREHLRLVSSDAYAKYKAGGLTAVTRQEADAILRLAGYVSPDVKRERVARVLSYFKDDAELGPFVLALVQLSQHDGRSDAAD